MWGYKPIADAKTRDEEKKTLDEWARQQDSTPWLRFSTADSRGSDPGELTEAVGDADAVKATTLGLKNLERVANMLMTATTKAGENFDDLEELYGRMLGQWALEMDHVAALVGGFESQQRHWGQDGVRFKPMPAARQAEAVAFLNSHAFDTPSFAIKPDILRRIEPNGALERIRASQLRVLNQLMNNAPIARLIELEDVRDQITKILDPKFAVPGGGPAGGGGQGGPGLDDDESATDTCWPDYAIRLRNTGSELR